MACDLLVLAPHPDDAELHCGGCIARHVRLGKRVVVVDATRGELGSRGDAAVREQERDAASAALGIVDRDNLGLPDGDLQPHDPTALASLVACLRRHRPRLLLANSGTARHPDHRACAELARRAGKAAALHRFGEGEALRGLRLLHYEAELPIQADLLSPCTEADWTRKLEALHCYRSQFGLDQRDGPATGIAQPRFLEWIDQRGRAWGYHADAPAAEAFERFDLPAPGDLSTLWPS